uniref:Uncharacterized protein n=1 Tax=Arundo donax TaxID=35708 RepID=A0A0A9DAF1_ARUDO
MGGWVESERRANAGRQPNHQKHKQEKEQVVERENGHLTRIKEKEERNCQFSSAQYYLFNSMDQGPVPSKGSWLPSSPYLFPCPSVCPFQILPFHRIHRHHPSPLQYYSP